MTLHLIKIQQLVDHLNVLADVISPENGFSLYFLGYLEYLKTGQISQALRDRLVDGRVCMREYLDDRAQHVHSRCERAGRNESFSPPGSTVPST